MKYLLSIHCWHIFVIFYWSLNSYVLSGNVFGEICPLELSWTFWYVEGLCYTNTVIHFRLSRHGKVNFNEDSFREYFSHNRAYGGSISQNIVSLNILLHVKLVKLIILWTLNRQAKIFLPIFRCFLSNHYTPTVQ